MTRPPFRAVHGSTHTRGQTLVEFALVFPLFVAMLFGLIDVGRLVYQHSTLSQAAREAARLAAVEASWMGETPATVPSCGTFGGPVCPANFTELKTHVVTAANRMVAPFGSIVSSRVWISCDDPGSAPTGNWTTDSCASNAVKDVVSVRVEMTFAPLTPVASGLVGPVVLSGSASMIIN
jgi:hypothetical protein